MHEEARNPSKRLKWRFNATPERRRNHRPSSRGECRPRPLSPPLRLSSLLKAEGDGQGQADLPVRGGERTGGLDGPFGLPIQRPIARALHEADLFDMPIRTDRKAKEHPTFVTHPPCDVWVGEMPFDLGADGAEVDFEVSLLDGFLREHVLKCMAWVRGNGFFQRSPLRARAAWACPFRRLLGLGLRGRFPIRPAFRGGGFRLGHAAHGLAGGFLLCGGSLAFGDGLGGPAILRRLN